MDDEITPWCIADSDRADGVRMGKMGEERKRAIGLVGYVPRIALEEFAVGRILSIFLAILWMPPVSAALETSTLLHGDAISSAIAFSRDGAMLAIGNEAGNLQVREWPSQRILLENDVHAAPIRGVAFSPDNRFLASSGADECLRTWSIETGEQLNIACPDDRTWIYSVSWSPDGRRIVSGDQAAYMKTWSADQLELLLNVDAGAYVGQVDWIDSSTIVIATGMGEVQFRDAADGSILRTLPAGHTFSISPDERLFAAVDFEDQLNVGVIESGVTVSMPEGRNFTSVRFSPSGGHLAAGTRGGAICLYAVDNWGTFNCWKPHSAFVGALAFSKDGRNLVSASGDGSVRIHVVDNVL